MVDSGQPFEFVVRPRLSLRRPIVSFIVLTAVIDYTAFDDLIDLLLDHATKQFGRINK